MKYFLTKTFILLVLVLFSIVSVFCLADGYTDAYYMRFTTPSQKSMILGTSRAAQGIRPDIINANLNRNDLFNYSFTIGHSPYGPVYLNSIKRKLDQHTDKGIFILAIDPWSISSNISDPEDVTEFFENDLFLKDLKNVSQYPNFSYLMNFYNQPYRNILLMSKYGIDIQKKIFNPNWIMFLHKDGWLDISIKNMDSVYLSDRLEETVKMYKNKHLPSSKRSSTRVDYLELTINYLKNYGEVFLVRLPIHPRIMEIEENFMPEFNEIVHDVSKSHKVPFLDLTEMNAKYTYIDGNHLYKESGKEVSKIISAWISSLEPPDK